MLGVSFSYPGIMHTGMICVLLVCEGAERQVSLCAYMSWLTLTPEDGLFRLVLYLMLSLINP